LAPRNTGLPQGLHLAGWNASADEENDSLPSRFAHTGLSISMNSQARPNCIERSSASAMTP
jgi:hypothetical protein